MKRCCCSSCFYSQDDVEALSFSISTLKLSLSVFYVIFGPFIVSRTAWPARSSRSTVKPSIPLQANLFLFFPFIIASFLFFLVFVSRMNSTVLCSYTKALSCPIRLFVITTAALNIICFQKSSAWAKDAKWQSLSHCCACGQLLVHTWRNDLAQFRLFILTYFIFRHLNATRFTLQLPFSFCLLLLEHQADHRPSRLSLLSAPRNLNHDSDRMSLLEVLLGQMCRCCEC